MAESDRAPELHQALVEGLKKRGLLPDPRIEAAFRAVPRHLFLPGVPLETVYADEAIPTKTREDLAISSSSQPAVMAIMLGQLDLQPGERVLEIGAGTGYNAALLAHIAGPSGRVATVDIDEDTVEAARAHLAAAGVANVRVVCRDGALGYEEEAPFDRIILTVGAWDIPQAWIEQLRPGGRLVLPLVLNGTVQKLVGFERTDDYLMSVSVADGGFMPMRGISAGPNVHIPLGPEPGLVLGLGTPRRVDAERVYDLLTGPFEDAATPLRTNTGDLWGGISLWLALHAPSMCSVVAVGEAATRKPILSPFSGSAGYRATIGLLEDDELCLLAPSPEDAAVSDGIPFGLAVRSYGNGDKTARHLADLLRNWEAAGRPSSTGLRITAYAHDALPAAEPASFVIDKPQSRLILDWVTR